MKTKEELNALKNEDETLNKKLSALTEVELEQIIGGANSSDYTLLATYSCPFCGQMHNFKFKGGGGRLSANIISYSACTKTKEVNMKSMDNIMVYSVDGEYYILKFNTIGYE